MITQEKMVEALREMNLPQEHLDWFKKWLLPEEAWNQCENPECLIQVAGVLDIDVVWILSAMCDCVESILFQAEEYDGRPLKAVELVKSYSKGKIYKGVELVHYGNLLQASDDTLSAAEELSDDSAPSASIAVCYAASYLAEIVLDICDEANISEIIDKCCAVLSWAECALSKKDFCSIIRNHIPWQMIEEKMQE